MRFVGPVQRAEFRIAEVAQLLGVAQSTLRFWEVEFKRWVRPARSAHGWRFYTDANIQRLREIRDLLRADGHTIAGAKKRLTGSGREKRSDAA